MNANELADRLEDGTENFTCIYNISAATMLRQQQAEIETLKMMLANRNDALDRLDLK
jgi:hypothetical protein